MNIAKLMIPKVSTVFLHENNTVRQGLERFMVHGYTAIPVLNSQEQYIGSVTEGDFLRVLKNRYDLNLRNAEGVSILAVERKVDCHPVSIDATMEDLVQKAMNQNFVPVIDDKKIFIGIVTRKDIIRFCYEKYIEKQTVS